MKTLRWERSPIGAEGADRIFMIVIIVIIQREINSGVNLLRFLSLIAAAGEKRARLSFS